MGAYNMSETISIKKLKKIMYKCLRWRLQIGDYIPHNEIPLDSEVNEFSRGVKTAYRDLLEEIEKIEQTENQRSFWKRKESDRYLYSEDFIDEMRWDSQIK
jgi:hypothetical protein